MASLSLLSLKRLTQKAERPAVSGTSMTVKQTIKLTVLAYLWIATVGAPQNVAPNRNPSNNGNPGNVSPGGQTQNNNNSNGKNPDSTSSGNAQNQWPNSAGGYPPGNNGWASGWVPPVNSQPVSGTNYPPNGQAYPTSGSGYPQGGYPGNGYVYPQGGSGYPGGGNGYTGGGSGYPPPSNGYPTGGNGYYNRGSGWSNSPGGNPWYGGPPQYPVRWDSADHMVGWYNPSAGNTAGPYQWQPPPSSG